MMKLRFGDYQLSNLGKINVVLGKNGCGKSTLLRAIDESHSDGYCRYVAPERGGSLRVDGNIESSMQDNAWYLSARRANRFEQFRESSVAEFRRLENLVLRKIEKDLDTRRDTAFTFDVVLSQMNGLLDNIEVVRTSDNGAFKVRYRGQTEWRDVATLSSGESELISLAIEVLSFAYVVQDEYHEGKNNWLLLDEPDVHLHPDLQHRLMKLLATSMQGVSGHVVIATHSTSIVGALASFDKARIALMKNGQKMLGFTGIEESMKAVLPIFGAHPLSNVFSERPVLLVEGDDDARIWHQAVRSSQGRIQVWPCVAGDVQSLAKYEETASEVISAVYDEAVAYSLRDRDDSPYEIDDVGPVVRARLNCRSAENLLLSDDVLKLLEETWCSFVTKCEEWIERNPDHPQAESFNRFKVGGWDRRNAGLKPLRNIIMAVTGSTKPWEVVVGQAIAELSNGTLSEQNSLADYLGPKLVGALKL